MRAVILLCLTLAAGCASRDAFDQETKWRWPGGGKQQTDLDRDRAQCRYEVASLATMAPSRPVAVPPGPYANSIAVIGSSMVSGPPAGMWELCMQGKGWQRVE